MNLQQLRIFVYTVKHKSLTVVARLLNIQQPTVTFHLNRLQENWGVPLFISNSHRMLKLTDAGKSLFHYAEQMVAVENEIEMTMGAYQEMKSGRLMLGSTYTPATYTLPRILASYKEQYPDISLILEVKTAPVILEMIKKFELDVGIISYDRIEDKDLVVHPLYRDNLILVMRPDASLAHKENLTIEDMSGLPIIAHEQQSVSKRIIDDWAKGCGIELQTVMEVSATETMKEVVMNGMGMAILSERSCKRERDEGKLIGKELPEHHLDRYIYIVHLKKKLMMPSMIQFMELLKQE